MPKELKKTSENVTSSQKTWYAFRVYTFTSAYSENLELLVTITSAFKSHDTKKDANEYARNIGVLGISIENPTGSFTYYPPTRIAKVEYNII